MDLLKKDFLEFVKEAGFPQSKFTDGQTWFDMTFEKHGIVIGNTLYYIGGGFTTISEHEIKEGRFLLQPSIADFLFFMPSGVHVELWGSQFSVKINDDEKPKRFSCGNPIEAMARAYLHFFIVVTD